MFRVLMVLSDFLVCLSHGSNDVGNAISPLIAILATSDKDYNDMIAFYVGATGIALGLAIFG